MATRNRTLVFIQFRNEKKSYRGTGMGRDHSASAKLLGRVVKDEESENDIEMATNKMSNALPPGWMSLIDDVNYDMSKIKQNMEKLSEHHKKGLLPQFEEDNLNDDQSIQVLTDYITKLFHDAQNKIKRIEGQKVGPQEDSMKKNVVSQLAGQLQGLSQTFRKNQRDYLQRLSGRKGKGRVVLENDDDVDSPEAFDVGFTETQLAAVAYSNTLADQRAKDVQQILKSIKELASIFNDLSLLVVEQGTILDRIDHNIETVSHNVDQGVKELEGANRYQKSYRKKLCMLLLCLCILIMIVVVIMRGFIPH